MKKKEHRQWSCYLKHILGF